MMDISKHNQTHICISVSDVDKASLLLEQKLGIVNFAAVSPNTIKVYDFSHEPKSLNKMFWEAGIEVSALSINSGNLEEYFKTMTGGVGIA